MFLLQTLSLLLPILAAGVFFIVAIKYKILIWLCRPIDGGVKFRGQPVFGANKTWRGVVIYVVGSILVCWLFWLGVQQGVEWVHPIFGQNPLGLGLVYGISYSVGELINSFVKRRLRIRPGRSTGVVQHIFDTVDGIVAAILAIGLIYGADWFQMFLVLLIGAGVHLTTDVIMKKHHLKK